MRRLTPAEILLQELGVTEPSEIDLEAIAHYGGAAVRERPLDGCEAHIIGVGDRAVITVRSDSHARRKRFSIAHELGHWHFHRGKRLICRKDDIENHERGPADREGAADRYAADLLLPRYLFEPMAAQYRRMSMAAARALADAFDASLTATAIRIVEHGPDPAMVICHGKQKRKWFRTGPDVPDRWFPRDDLDPASLAFDVLHGDQRQSRQAVMGAGAWFDRYDADRYELLEQTIRTGPDEILTLLLFTDEAMLEETGRSRY